MVRLVHIRRPLIRARGNQFYRDKADRSQGTYCGAAAGGYDLTSRGARTDRSRAACEEFFAARGLRLCPACESARRAHQ